MTTIKIRKAKKNDINRITEIWSQNQIQSVGKPTNSKTIKKFKKTMRKELKLSNTVVIVAQNNSKEIIGWQGIFSMLKNPILGKHVAQINTYLDLKSSTPDLGKQLTDQTIKAARKKGVEHIYAWVKEDNIAAIRLSKNFSEQEYRIPNSKKGSIPNLILYIVDVDGEE